MTAMLACDMLPLTRYGHLVRGAIFDPLMAGARHWQGVIRGEEWQADTMRSRTRATSTAGATERAAEQAGATGIAPAC